jgi:hypothetical protein
MGHDKNKWQHYIDSYFESCRNISQDEENEEEDDIDEDNCFFTNPLKIRDFLVHPFT